MCNPARMRYIVKFWDGEIIKVPKKIGEQLIYLKENKNKSNIKTAIIRGAIYEIAGIEKVYPEWREKQIMLPETVERPVTKETKERVDKEIRDKFTR